MALLVTDIAEPTPQKPGFFDKNPVSQRSRVFNGQLIELLLLPREGFSAEFDHPDYTTECHFASRLDAEVV